MEDELVQSAQARNVSCYMVASLADRQKQVDTLHPHPDRGLDAVLLLQHANLHGKDGLSIDKPM
eukprot:3169285-Amphidinium_carterae.1